MKEDILRQIGTIARALDSIANIEFKEMQLNRGQYLYLVRIKENPSIISDHLAGMLNVDRTTTARSIKKLEDNGLIKRKNDQKNKKIKHLFVTDKGEELAQRINFDPEQIVRNRENIKQDRKNIKELESKILKNSYAIQVNKDLEKEKIRISEELSNTPWYKFLKKRKLKKELDNVEKSYNDSSKLLREIRNSLFEKVSKINVKEQENITKEKENEIKRNLDENSIIQKQSTILTK